MTTLSTPQDVALTAPPLPVDEPSSLSYMSLQPPVSAPLVPAPYNPTRVPPNWNIIINNNNNNNDKDNPLPVPLPAQVDSGTRAALVPPDQMVRIGAASASATTPDIGPRAVVVPPQTISGLAKTARLAFALKMRSGIRQRRRAKRRAFRTGLLERSCPERRIRRGEVVRRWVMQLPFAAPLDRLGMDAPRDSQEANFSFCMAHAPSPRSVTTGRYNALYGVAGDIIKKELDGATRSLLNRALGGDSSNESEGEDEEMGEPEEKAAGNVKQVGGGEDEDEEEEDDDAEMEEEDDEDELSEEHPPDCDCGRDDVEDDEFKYRFARPRIRPGVGAGAGTGDHTVVGTGDLLSS